MERSKAAFRALRETVGITQQAFADLFGVKILSVKRWESPTYPQQAPGAAWEALEELEQAQLEACTQALVKVIARPREATGGAQPVEVPYWSSAAGYEACRGSDGITWTEANATARRLAAILVDRGLSVEWVDGEDCADPIL